ncbi:MAG: ComEC/Rec2 family competence protein [Pseudomonadota bacterium]
MRVNDSGEKEQREAEYDERFFVAVDGEAFTATIAKPKAPKASVDTTGLVSIEDTDSLALEPLHKPEAPRHTQRSTISISRLQSYLSTQLAMEEAQGTSFLLIPVIMIAGVTSYFTLPAEPAAHNFPIAVLALLLVRWALRRSSLAKKQMINAATIFVLAMGLGQWRTMAMDTAMLGSEVSTNLTAQIRSIEQRPNGSVRYTLDVISTERPKLYYAPTRVRATTRRPVVGAELGEGLRGYVRLRPPSGPVRPGGYDFSFNNYFQNIGANGFFLGQPDAYKLNRDEWNARIQIEKWRLWLARHIQSQSATRSGAVAAALITGQKASIPEDVTEALRVSGLAHILSISGLHMALVAGTVMFALRIMFAMSPEISAYRPTKKYAALAGFGAIFIYLFLAGTSVATQRSFIMLAVMLGAILSDRSALTMRNLSIAAIAVVLIAPEAVLGPSFQMSFAATLALIAAYRAWTKHRSSKFQDLKTDGSLHPRVIKKSTSFITGLSMTSIIAGAATGIFAAYHFHRVAVFGLFGNLLAMPIVSIITMPSAILATLLIPVGLDGYVYQAMNWSIELVIKISVFVANNSPNGAVGAISQNTLLCLSLGLILMSVFSSKLKYLSLVFLIPALIAQKNLSTPIMVISEDARQVAIVKEDGNLVTNRARPNGFILDQWQAAYKSQDVLKPGSDDGFKCQKSEFCSYSNLINNIKNDVLYVENREYYLSNIENICANYQIIVLAFAPAPMTCNLARDRDKTPLIVTAQQLALHGSAEIRQDPNDDNAFRVQFALGDASRPWQSHRKYSRSARNLAPIQRNNQ